MYVAVSKDSSKILGTYFIHPNNKGGGSHICNCGYATALGETSKGIGYQMCIHSLALAKSQGYRAMQYNFVISSNERAVRLWTRYVVVMECIPQQRFD